MMKKTFASILLKFVKFASGSITSPFKNMRRSYDEACEYFGEANLHAGKTIPVTATCFMGISFAIWYIQNSHHAYNHSGQCLRFFLYRLVWRSYISLYFYCHRGQQFYKRKRSFQNEYLRRP